jgi:hypothetical protein
LLQHGSFLNDLPQRYPAVKALVFFHAKDDQTVTYQKLDWSTETDPALKRVIASAIKRWTPETLLGEGRGNPEKP